jgi:outer membrane protein insertion porin family
MRTSAVIWAATGVLLSALCPGDGPPAAFAAELPRVIRIDIECREPIDGEAIRGLLPFDVGDQLRPTALAEARRLLERRDLFESVELGSTPTPGGVTVQIRMKRLALVNLIRFEGNDAIGNEELRRMSRLRSGSPLTQENRTYAADRIREGYEAQGFGQARVVAVVGEIAPGEVDVTFHITEGQPAIIESLAVSGVPADIAAELTDLIDLEVGDRYAKKPQRAALDAIVRHMRENRFYEVRAEAKWTPTGEHGGRLMFVIDPGPVFQIKFTGNAKLSGADLLGTVDLLERPIITDGTWREIARRSVHAYQEAGYHRATVKLAAIEARVDPLPTRIVRFDVREGGSYRVRAITVEGNRSIVDADLRGVMETQPPSWVPWRRGVLIDDVLKADAKRIVALYGRNGFPSAAVTATKVKHEAGRIDIHIAVDEGPQVIVSEVRTVGIDALGRQLPPLRTKPGMPLDEEKVEQDRRALAAALAADGYAAAQVEADVAVLGDGAQTRTAAVTLTAVPRAQVRIGRIIVQNNFDTRAKVVLRELPFRSGDVLDPDLLLTGQGKVYQLGLFRSVTVRAADAGPDPATRDVIVRVAEKPPGMFQWGIGYNTRDGFRGLGQVGYHNLQGLGRSVTLSGQIDVDVDDPEPSQYLGDLSYREPHLLDTRSSASLKFVAQRSQRDIDDYKLERFAVIPGLERPLIGRLIGGLAVQIDHARIFDVASDIAAEPDFNDEGKFFSVSLDPFLVHNALDDELRPTRGMFESLRLRFAPSVLGTDVPLVKIVGQHSHYIPVGNFFTFIYAARVGWARALNAGEQIPIHERFFLGGRTTVRGFSENSLGPQASCESDDPDEDCARNPLGGDVSVNLNAETHFPLLYGVRGAAFVDGGGVYLQTHAAKDEEFRETAGVGLRYMTPVGPLSLDYGFKLDRRDGESLGQIHFSIGRVF